MIVWQLFVVFFRIGLFTFGGGYAMVPLIQREMISHQWLSFQQFSDILAISQITPGPLAINTATYVGFQVAGLVGSAAATIGVVMPSLLLITWLNRILDRFWTHPLNRMTFYGLRPVVVALIGTATVFFAQASLLRPIAQWQSIILSDPLSLVSPLGVLLFLATLYFDTRRKVHPIALILLCGVAAMGILALFPGLA